MARALSFYGDANAIPNILHVQKLSIVLTKKPSSKSQRFPAGSFVPESKIRNSLFKSRIAELEILI